MRIRLISVGTRMPGWVNEGVEEYARRIQNDLGFSLIEVPLAKRSKAQAVAQFMAKEGDAMLGKIDRDEFVVALDVKGKSLDTSALAARLQYFREESRNICLLIGGPDGLHPSCLARADEKWSLSALTLPHPLVRVLITEQLYRAHSLLQGHPYHRE
ncbi:MAG: 23S rRNA (pseudouridine(1915)-N(3))-methyltransferase RlmH [Proteobacteria bacterium]|nr:23S rRNA (pseudouridine(1915)-N(3))-methyltransferase RlmH [Pseudomonadota bacterium]MDA0928816.1 23S rRNA (pseudouridine(1915)-N(3))-methyltransferase RlmH [Pseudomonadota bacterium]